MLKPYKMAFLDKYAFAVTARDFDGADDNAAMDHGLTLCGTHMIEITQADRLVARIPKGAKHHGAQLAE
jgi:hypothetical protein